MNYDFDAKAEMILNKKFNSKIHAGYDPVDVDTFFDEVIEYIKQVQNFYLETKKSKSVYEQQINELNKTNKLLTETNNKLQSEIDELKKEGYSNIKIIEEVK